MKTVRSIVTDAGGAAAVAEASKTTRKTVGVTAVRNWFSNGIPDIHWPLIQSLTEVSADELFQANELVRANEPAEG